LTAQTADTEQVSAQALRDVFDGAPAYAVGVEEEVLLLHRDTLELAPRAREVLAVLDDDERFKLELPASQIEIITPPLSDAGAVETALRDGRRTLARAAAGIVRFAVAGVHPVSAGAGELNRLPRYQNLIDEYGEVAARQLVCALQVHVSVGDSERALAIYNAARAYLPELAALAANAPFYEGRDTGLASVRPKLCELLPRQGVPPVIDSWDSYAEALQWGARARVLPDARTWWWELRLHPRFGTLEFRVPDAQSSVRSASGIIGFVHAIVAWLGERHDAGQVLPAVSSWRIEENRWSACRYGVQGAMVDLETGERLPTRQRLHQLLDSVSQAAERIGAAPALEHARELVEVNGALAQRQAARAGGAPAVVRWLVDRFLE
jgi:carboxylate-amine ligase